MQRSTRSAQKSIDRLDRFRGLPSTSAILDQMEQQKQNAASIHPMLMTQSKNNPGSTIPQTLTEIKKVGTDNQQ
jgi:hypothetical protein